MNGTSGTGGATRWRRLGTTFCLSIPEGRLQELHTPLEYNSCKPSAKNCWFVRSQEGRVRGIVDGTCRVVGVVEELEGGE